MKDDMSERMDKRVDKEEGRDELTAPFGSSTEYKQPASNLPQSVSQRELLRENEDMGVNSWTGKEKTI